MRTEDFHSRALGVLALFLVALLAASIVASAVAPLLARQSETEIYVDPQTGLAWAAEIPPGYDGPRVPTCVTDDLVIEVPEVRINGREYVPDPPSRFVPGVRSTARLFQTREPLR